MQTQDDTTDNDVISEYGDKTIEIFSYPTRVPHLTIFPIVVFIVIVLNM